MSRLDEEHAYRLKKRQAIQQSGKQPYPSHVTPTHSIETVLKNFGDFADQQTNISVVGRLKTIRMHGGSCFIHIDDGSGGIQSYIKRDAVGDATYMDFKNYYDIGDFLQVSGTLFSTKKGEKTILAQKIAMGAKSLLPLPEKWHGLQDVEIRYRKRYLDLIANKEVRILFEKRSRIINVIRALLRDNGFIEVETPILQPLPGGANARPFKTHHHALDLDLYLRIAPELYLKRLIIGGFTKVFEVARCFRNEGIDRDHNPEFTQVEFYAAYWDYRQMMDFTEKIIAAVANDVLNASELQLKGSAINLALPFKRLSFRDAIQQNASIDIDTADDEALLTVLTGHKISVSKPVTRPRLLDELFKGFVRPRCIEPTFVTDYPIELSPLAKKIYDNPRYVERFQLLIGGIELCNAFSELNDPIDQEERFAAQEKMRAAGDEEAQRIDRDFIEALSYGMPPTAGIGIGIDRLVTLFTNSANLKEVILFPTLKPKKNDD
ncbi:MAG: lysine--tRNA ligase [Patescibacteria group bacterium]